MPSKITIAEYGNYNTPQTFQLGNLSPPPDPPQLGQWWFDFSRIAEANVQLSLGTEMSCVTSFTSFFPIFGIFVQPDGDIPSANIWDGSITPAVQLNMPGVVVGAFHGFNAKATIPNPRAKMQVLFAYTVGTLSTIGLVHTTFSYRSILLTAQGV